MRICIISENQYGCGASIAASRLCSSFVEQGHKLDFIYQTPHSFQSDVSSNPQFHRVNTNPLYIYPSLALKKISKAFFRTYMNNNYKKITNVLKRCKPDVINLHNVASILSYKEIYKLSECYPVVWTMHDCFALKSFPYKFKNRFNKEVTTSNIRTFFIEKEYINKLLARKNVCFVSPSKWLKEYVSDGNYRIKNKILHIPNGLSPKEFFPEQKLLSRKKIGLHSNKFYILFVASNITYERKNIKLLHDSLDLLGDVPINIIALGKVSYRDKKRYNKITFINPTFNFNELRYIYSSADYFVITSLIDNLPNTVLESLFCGTPVIGSNTGGIPEMIIQDKTGILFDPYSPESLVKAIREGYNKTFEDKYIRIWSNQYSNKVQEQKYYKVFSDLKNL